MINVVGKRKIFYGFSLLLIGAGIFSIIFWGLHFGIDFKGGSFLQIEWSDQQPNAQKIKDQLAPLNLGDITIQPTGDKGTILRLKDIDEATHQKVLSAL